MKQQNPKAAALALYMNATTPADYEAAAHALAAVLDAKSKARTPLEDLAAPVPRPKRSAPVLGFLCAWTDGSTTYQRVTFDPRHKWAAAFQACDRLRRLRARRRWREVLTLCGMPSTVRGPLGITLDSADWLALVKAAAMPALESILCEETGETFTPSTTAGAGDPAAVVEIVERLAASAEAWRERMARQVAQAEALRVQMLAGVRQPYKHGLRVIAQAA